MDRNPAADLTLRGPAFEWPLWSTTARLAVRNPHHLPSALRLVEHELVAVELAASRFRHDSEVRRLAHRGGRSARISPVLGALLDAAVTAARRTDGAVGPTLGNALAMLGYDRDLTQIRALGDGVRLLERPAPGWQRVELAEDRRSVTVPPDVQLDLGATAKAWAADRCARVVADELGIGVLVSLGGDIATADARPSEGWQVLVQDQPGDPASRVTLPSGAALATSSTRSRQWRRDGRVLHHILDPMTCLPVQPVWRSVTVAATSCVDANTWSTAALVRGRDAMRTLAAQGLPARLVGESGQLVHLGPGRRRAR